MESAREDLREAVRFLLEASEQNHWDFRKQMDASV